MIQFTPDRDEPKFQKLISLARELKMIVPEMFMEMQVWDRPHDDPQAKLLYHVKQRSRSWTRNAYNLLFCTMGSKDGDGVGFGAGQLTLKDTSAGVRTGNYPINNGVRSSNTNDGLATLDTYTSVSGGVMAAAGDATLGIQLGTGVAVESFEDYVVSLIANGTGLGQMSYVQSEIPIFSYDGGSKTCYNSHSRFINNNSPAGITVGEVGLVYYLGGANTNWRAYKCILSRDKLSAATLVPVAGQVKVTYTIGLTYPA